LAAGADAIFGGALGADFFGGALSFAGSGGADANGRARHRLLLARIGNRGAPSATISGLAGTGLAAA
jgi:hypothetical protein